jgi:RNA polymerase sigma-70 factor (ECF subfamily)
LNKKASNELMFNDIIKHHWGHIIALLTNYLNDIQLAEDVMQDAFESALIHWPQNGIPKNPQAWLFTTAKHKALDKLRRGKTFSEKQTYYKNLLDFDTSDNVREDKYTIPDERLRLIFTCCHPALNSSVSVALTLRLLGGLTTSEIANAYLVKKETMAQRLVRGKKKIKQAQIPYIIPEKNDFSKRLDKVLKVLYLIFNEGYAASTGMIIIRDTLCDEAIRLTEILYYLCPNEPEVSGLLALMLLHNSRKQARGNNLGEFVPLEYQNRGLWNNEEIQQGLNLIQSSLKLKKIGGYQLQATISAIHAESKDYQSTNWHEIVLVYDELLKYAPTDVVRLNRLVALSEIKCDINLINDLNKLKSSLISYQPFYIVKASFLEKLGQYEKAKYNYKRAIELTNNQVSKDYLVKKILNL